MSRSYSEIAGDRLRAELGLRRMTQKDLATALRVTPKKAHRLMNGKSWTLDDLDAVEAALGIALIESSPPVPLRFPVDPHRDDTPIVIPGEEQAA